MQKRINKASAHLESSEPGCQEGRISSLACMVHLPLIKIHMVDRYEGENEQDIQREHEKDEAV